MRVVRKRHFLGRELKIRSSVECTVGILRTRSVTYKSYLILLNDFVYNESSSVCHSCVTKLCRTWRSTAGALAAKRRRPSDTSRSDVCVSCAKLGTITEFIVLLFDERSAKGRCRVSCFCLLFGEEITS